MWTGWPDDGLTWRYIVKAPSTADLLAESRTMKARRALTLNLSLLASLPAALLGTSATADTIYNLSLIHI